AWVGEDHWLRLVALAVFCAAVLELAALPFAFWSGFILEHRHDLSNQTFGRWVWRRLKLYLLRGPFGPALLLRLYGLIWHAGPWWWLWAAAGWLALTLLLGRVVPVLILPLFYRVSPLDCPDLDERFRRLAGGTGLRLEGIFKLHLSDDTRKVNAA